jgi:hypothetical protein
VNGKPGPRPIGPLALARRHLRPGSTGRRSGVVLALVLGAALLAGLLLLLLR